MEAAVEVTEAAVEAEAAAVVAEAAAGDAESEVEAAEAEPAAALAATRKADAVATVEAQQCAEEAELTQAAGSLCLKPAAGSTPSSTEEECVAPMPTVHMPGAPHLKYASSTSMPSRGPGEVASDNLGQMSPRSGMSDASTLESFSSFSSPRAPNVSHDQFLSRLPDGLSPRSADCASVTVDASWRCSWCTCRPKETSSFHEGPAGLASLCDVCGSSYRSTREQKINRVAAAKHIVQNVWRRNQLGSDRKAIEESEVGSPSSESNLSSPEPASPAGRRASGSDGADGHVGLRQADGRQMMGPAEGAVLYYETSEDEHSQAPLARLGALVASGVVTASTKVVRRANASACFAAPPSCPGLGPSVRG
eukprot:SAG11_NODE_3452_length_2440_cov_2.349423_2_plen_365_part_00